MEKPLNLAISKEMQIKQDNIAVEESGGGRTLSISEGNQPQ
jgi:hypothetical protein